MKLYLIFWTCILFIYFQIIAETSTTSTTTSKQIEESSIIHQIKWTSDIKYSKCHQRKQLNSKSRLVQEKNFVLCTNVQTSIKWFLRVCFFVNGLIMLNKHIKIIYLFFSGIKRQSKKKYKLYPPAILLINK